MQDAIKLADTILDYFCRAWDELTGMYDRIAMTIMALVLISNLLYPFYSGPAHLMIPGDAFQTITILPSLPFISIFMFIEANHWEGNARFLRLVLGFGFMILFMFLVVMDINSVYASQYTPMHTPPNVPGTASVPQVAVA